MKLLIPFLLVTANAQTTDPKQILLAAVDAGKKLQSIEYTVTSLPGATPVKALIIEQKANVSGGGRQIPSKYFVRIDGGPNQDLVQYAYDGKSTRLKVGSGPSNIEVIDNPKDYELGQFLGGYPSPEMPMFGASFEASAKSAKLTYKGKRTIGTFTCDLVEVKRIVPVPGQGDTEITNTWAFDRSTHLPVQVDEPYLKTVTSLKLNPKLNDGVFRLEGREVRTTARQHLDQPLLSVGSKAPTFALRDGSGKLRTLQEFRGKYLLVDFWGTWCKPCIRSMPKLQALHAKYRAKGLVVLGVAVADKEFSPAKFMRRNNFTYPTLVKGDAMAASYRAKLLPTLYLIDRQGKIIYRQAGVSPQGEATLAKLIARLIA